MTMERPAPPEINARKGFAQLLEPSTARMVTPAQKTPVTMHRGVPQRGFAHPFVETTVANPRKPARPAQRIAVSARRNAGMEPAMPQRIAPRV